jgi:peroxiredoxin
MIAEGDTAPQFELPGTDGSEIRTYDLADHLERGAAVLVFYPFDFSPVCREELCDLRDAEWFTISETVDVFGVSTDSAYAHRAFAQELDLSFPLLSDADGSVNEAYGVQYDSWEDHDGVAKRATFVLDSSLTVRYAWHADDARERSALMEIRDALGEVVSLPGER